MNNAEQENRRLNAILRAKDEYIAAASHDLKNPIGAMLLNVSVLEKLGALNSHQTQVVERIKKSIDQLCELVEQLLEVERIDSTGDLRLEPLDASELLADAADEFVPACEGKQQALSVLPLEGQPHIYGDRAQLRQALRNLVGNAVKYTPAGGRITLSAEIDDSVARLKVQDTGPGIPTACLPHIFDKFYRADGAQAIEGNGLGLAIVKSIVAQHGGRIEVDSAPGRGSCFSISLPLAYAIPYAFRPNTVPARVPSEYQWTYTAIN